MAKVLFNSWAERYSRDMAGHTKAIKKLLARSMLRQLSVQSVLDPAVGDGIVLKQFLGNLKTKPALFINDASAKMLEQSRANFPKANTFQINFLAEEMIKKIGANTMDLIFVSQVFDLIPGYKDKRKLITNLHSVLKKGGYLLAVGEEPPLFTVSSRLSKKENEFFRQLFEGIDSWDLAHEIVHTPDSKCFYLLQTCRVPIDRKHSMYLHLAQKVK